MNLYVILIIISTVRNENILSFDYTSIGGLIALNFNYYNYNRSGLFINTAFPFSIINKNYQDGIGSKRMLDLSLWLVEKEYAYTLIESNFTLGQAHLDNYKYYCQSNDKRHLSDVLSLSFKHDEESLSFVHLLYKERQIEKRQFAFEGMKNRLFIGGVPNNLHKNMLYKGKCKIKENVYEWTCPIKRVSYGDIILDMNEEAIFYSSIDDAIYSNQLFDFETDCCSKNSLPFFSVPPTTENWDKLFCKIEEVFSQRETWNVNSFTKFLIWFDSEYSNLNDEEIEKKPNFIMGKIITALYGRIPISLSANPLLEPYLIKMCKVGLKIVRKNITGSAFQKLSEENRKKGMDAIYMFLKYSNLEQLLFE